MNDVEYRFFSAIADRDALLVRLAEHVGQAVFMKTVEELREDPFYNGSFPSSNYFEGLFLNPPVLPGLERRDCSVAMDGLRYFGCGCEDMSLRALVYAVCIVMRSDDITLEDTAELVSALQGTPEELGFDALRFFAWMYIAERGSDENTLRAFISVLLDMTLRRPSPKSWDVASWNKIVDSLLSRWISIDPPRTEPPRPDQR